MRGRAVLVAAISISAVALFVLPLAGWPPTVRLPVLLVLPLLAWLFVARPFALTTGQLTTWDNWQPSRRAIWTAVAVTSIVLGWIVLTRFRSAEINAIDFTVYFDRPAFQTAGGHPLLVETADIPAAAYRSQLAVHAFWVMFPISVLYLVAASPFWLLALSVVAVVAGGAHTFRIVRTLGAGSMLATAAATAFVLNKTTAQILNYGFHAEVLYLWFIPWLLDAGIARRRWQYLAAALMCVLVKEDAFMPLFAAAVALTLNGSAGMTLKDRVIFLGVPIGLALANLGIYYRWVLPLFHESGIPAYAGAWATFGATPFQIVAGMARDAPQVIARVIRSGFFRDILVPHLFLPLIGWRWLIGVVPVVVLYGASDVEPIRQFGVYYPAVLLPFLVIGAAVGSKTLFTALRGDSPKSRLGAAALVVAGAILVGSSGSGYSLRPWRPEVAAVGSVIQSFNSEPIILVQSGLYPHAGYGTNVKLLTRDTLHDPANTKAIVVLAPALSAYPMTTEDVLRQIEGEETVLSREGLLVKRRR